MSEKRSIFEEVGGDTERAAAVVGAISLFNWTYCGDDYGWRAYTAY